MSDKSPASRLRNAIRGVVLKLRRNASSTKSVSCESVAHTSASDSSASPPKM